MFQKSVKTIHYSWNYLLKMQLYLQFTQHTSSIVLVIMYEFLNCPECMLLNQIVQIFWLCLFDMVMLWCTTPASTSITPIHYVMQQHHISFCQCCACILNTSRVDYSYNNVSINYSISMTTVMNFHIIITVVVI